MKKKILAFITVLALVCAMLPMAVSAATVANGTCGNNLTWQLDSNGTLTISGNGAMDDFSQGTPWYAYNASIKAVTIASGVTAIGDYAFAFTAATNVTISSTVKTIGEGAFAFTKLASVTIPGSVTTIGAQAFFECINLTFVTIPKSVSSIGSAAFASCGKLTGIMVAANNANYSSDQKGVLFNKNKTLLIQAPGAISDSYAVPTGVAGIGDFAFYNCGGLTAVTLPAGVVSVGNGAFAYTGLSTVIIPASVISIGASALESCQKLSGIWVAANNPKYASDNNGVLFDKNKTVLIQAPGAISGSYTVPYGVTVIADNAFYDCTELESVTLSTTVTRIGNAAFAYAGLTSVTIPNSVKTIGADAFAFTKLTSVTVPGSVSYISKGAFGFTSLATVIVKDGVQSIGDYAFAGCAELTSVSIPFSVGRIGNSAFSACEKLADVYYAGAQSQWNGIAIGADNECLTNANIHFAGAETALVVAARLDVGNSLSMQFAVPKAKLANWAGTYAQIDHTRSDGSVKTTKIPYEQWMTDSASPDYLVISYSGVAAKEMTDELEVSIYNAAGRQLGATYTDSIRGYVMRNFGKFGAKVDRLFADMLNYGAEAQIYFKNKTNDLANAQMNATQRGYATQTDPVVTNTATAGIQARLDLQYKIALQIAIPAAYKNQTITYSFTNQKGVFSGEIPVNVRTEGDMSFIIVDAIVVGDARQTVTVKANGVEILHDSVESYIARMSSSNNMAALCKAIMKFADAARDYFK